MSCKKGGFINNRHNDGKDDSKTLMRSMSWCAGWTYVVTFNWKTDGTSYRCWNQLSKLRNSSKKILDTGAANIFRWKGIWPKCIPILEFMLFAMLCKKQKEKKCNYIERIMQVEQEAYSSFVLSILCFSLIFFFLCTIMDLWI